jgi:hypothetical protein
MEENKYIKILNIFTEKDTEEPRAWMTHPFVADKYVIATDAHSLVFFDKDLAPNFEPPVGYNALPMLKLFCVEHNKNFIIPTSTLKEGLGKCDMVDDTDTVGKNVDCAACKGEGEVEWEFDHKGTTYRNEFECPMCKGDGLEQKARQIPNGKKVYAYHNNYIQISDSVFSAQLINQLVEVADILKQDSVALTYQIAPNKGSLFLVGEAGVLLMPIMMPEYTLSDDTSPIKFTIKYND